ncbi:hypothetical protein HDU91_000291 [Kappamyces sp. JEL0680]|nr:hypothetical protein HDU91_000291 [Kappamyces sp. JEL0680]
MAHQSAALSLYLTLDLRKAPEDCATRITYSGSNPDQVSLVPRENFLCRIMQWTSNIYGKGPLPPFELAIDNPIPLGRGLGSSASASLGAIMAASLLLDLNLAQDDILDLGVMLEGHPDNISASLYGGWVASFMRASNVGDVSDESMTATAESVSTPASIAASHGLSGHLAHSMPLAINPSIRAVVCIPDFTLATSLARSVLPKTYSREDLIFNLGRCTVLSQLLSQPVLSPELIGEAMQDRIHQSYRGGLVPGLTECLAMTPAAHPGKQPAVDGRTAGNVSVGGWTYGACACDRPFQRDWRGAREAVSVAGDHGLGADS